MRAFPLLLPALLIYTNLHAQSFTGLPAGQITAIQLMPQNPAWVNNSENGTEINIFSASGLAGTNAYYFSKDFATNGFDGRAVEGVDYFKNNHSGKKYFWGNIDVLGPAASFVVKDIHHFGFYTRTRQITNAGNIDFESSKLIGDLKRDSFPASYALKNAGFATHVFAEFGVTYGMVLHIDYYHILKGGITVKYLAGFAAGSLFTPSATVTKNNRDSLSNVSGDFTILYSDNILPFADNDFANDFSSYANRNGGGSFGLDLGVVYEYHPIGDPNQTNTPYLYSIAASLTDLGSIPYRADTGSGSYKLSFRNKSETQFNKQADESYLLYFNRLQRDTLLKKEQEIKKFKVGLPTAFRLNVDCNVLSNFWVGVNVLLNLRGSGTDIYRPGYVSSFNFSLRYSRKWLMVGLPVTYSGYQNFTLGAMFQAGPLFVGSNSFVSSIAANQLRNLDAFAGVTLKLKKMRNAY